MRREGEVVVAADGVELSGALVVPAGASGLVVFAHGSGSSRRSPRSGAVAATLNDGGLATLLIDLLDPAEAAEDAASGRLRLDIALLAGRLGLAIDWALSAGSVGPGAVGLFGASTGAAAALVAAADRPGVVGAIVSRGGRPDLAGDALARVRAPTLLVVGGADPEVLSLNRAAAASLGGPHRLVVVPGATHLFPEPGALEAVAREACAWFRAHLRVGQVTT